MRSARFLFLSLACSLCLLAARAEATPISGGSTAVEVTGGAAGLALDVVGTATIDSIGRIILPVTGGDVDLAALTGTIEHDGSGIEITGSSAQGNVRTLEAQNFVIDLTNGVLRADVSFLVNGVEQSSADDMVLFDVRACLLTAASDPCFDSGNQLVMNGFGLRYADGVPQTFAAFLYADSDPSDDDFVAGLLEGLDFGIANPRVEAGSVPEPAAAGLLLLGLAGLWVSGRRRESR